MSNTVIKIEAGEVELMGCGVALVMQDSDGGVQNVVLTMAELRAILAGLEALEGTGAAVLAI